MEFGRLRRFRCEFQCIYLNLPFVHTVFYVISSFDSVSARWGRVAIDIDLMTSIVSIELPNLFQIWNGLGKGCLNTARKFCSGMVGNHCVDKVTHFRLMTAIDPRRATKINRRERKSTIYTQLSYSQIDYHCTSFFL
jgi:hypothetical protein